MNFLLLMIAADYAKAGGYIDLVEVLGAHMQNECNVEAVNGKEKIILNFYYLISAIFSFSRTLHL